MRKGRIAGTILVALMAAFVTASLVLVGTRLQTTDQGTHAISDDAIEANIETSLTGTEDPDANDASTSVTSDEPFYYSSLSDDEKTAYDEIYAIISNHDESGTVSTADETTMQKCITAVMNDHPEIFWANGEASYTRNTLLGQSTLTPAYQVGTDEWQDYQQELDERVNEYLSTLDDGMTEYDKVQHAYEYVISNTEYTKDTRNARSSYGGLVDGKGVCVAYAKEMQLLLQKSGIWCTYVTGDTEKDVPHAWCLVRVNGKYAHSDPTYGDPSYETEGNVTLPDISYDYMCLSTEQLEASGRKTDDDVKNILPETTDTLDWYVTHDAYVNDADSDVPSTQFDEVTSNGGNVIRLKYATDDLFNNAVSRLQEGTYLQAELVSRSLTTGSTQYGYATSPTMRTIWMMLS